MLAFVLLVAAPGYAGAADSIALRGPTKPVATDGRVAFSGTIVPALAGETVGLYVRKRGAWSLLRTTTSGAAGQFAFVTRVKRHAVFVARGTNGAGAPVDSAPVSIVIRPRLTARVVGSRRVGGRLYLAGRIQPRQAGRLVLTQGSRSRTVRVHPDGRFRAGLTTTRLLRYTATIRIRPATGYVARSAVHSIRVTTAPIGLGAHGAVVVALKYALARLHYTIPAVNGTYDYATADAVLVFQKVHGLARTGSVSGRVWAVLARSGPPLARIRKGDHIEVSKTRQVLFEVRHGEVVGVSHVSTGATGNTPVGRWRVYGRVPGFNGSGMYDSLFFTGAFAIHGYHSVPAYPASHGCVRVPFWFARHLFARWSVGTPVYVFP